MKVTLNIDFELNDEEKLALASLAALTSTVAVDAALTSSVAVESERGYQTKEDASAKRKPGRPAKVEKDAETPTPIESKSGVSAEEAHSELVKLANAKGKPAVVKILRSLGVEKFEQLSAKQYAEAKAQAVEALSDGEESF